MGRSTIMHHCIQNSDGYLAFVNWFSVNMQVKNEAGIKQEYVTEEIDLNCNYKLELKVDYSTMVHKYDKKTTVQL